MRKFNLETGVAYVNALNIPFLWWEIVQSMLRHSHIISLRGLEPLSSSYKPQYSFYVCPLVVFFVYDRS